MNYGRAVRMVRSARNLDQKELAARVGLDPSYISLIEKGEREPAVKSLKKISDALEIPPHLFALLASEDKDLRHVSKRQAEIIGRQLLQALVSIKDASE